VTAGVSPLSAGVGGGKSGKKNKQDKKAVSLMKVR